MNVIILSLAMVASPTQAQAEDSTAIVVSNHRDPNEVVCEKVVPAGSRLVTKRVCLTRSEWDARRRADRENLEEITRRDLQWNSPPDG